MSVTLKVPSVGESVQEATVGLWKKAEGDWIQLDEPLVEIESEKATLEVPSPASGVLKKILRVQGETVAIGESLADIDDGAARPEAKPETPRSETTRAEPRPAAKGRASSAAEPEIRPEPTANGASAPAAAAAISTPPAAVAPAAVVTAPRAAAVVTAPRAAPSARKLMAESGLAAVDIQGSGRGGRIQSTDVTRALDARPSEPSDAGVEERAPADPLSEPPSERIVPMTALRKTIARRLVEAQNTAAILTTFNEVDMSAVLALRERHQERFAKQHGVKLGFTSFFVKAVIDALRAFPVVNAEVRGTDIIYKDHYDIGVAVGGGKGLVVPVVRDADRLSFAEVEKTVAALAVRARENRLQMPELQGGTFTISNGGVYGSMLSTPILNPPQSGILGLHSIQKRAVVIDDQIVVRPMMFVALSYDHRIVDGREAVQFLVRVKDCVESPDRILLEV